MLVSSLYLAIECAIRTWLLVITYYWLSDCMFMNLSFLVSEHFFSNFINGLNLVFQGRQRPLKYEVFKNKHGIKNWHKNLLFSEIIVLLIHCILYNTS